MKTTTYLVLAVTLGACSDDPPTFADAAPGLDGAPDSDAADDPDGPPQTEVTIHVLRFDGDGLPDVGARVYIAGADGAVVDTRTVDATGVVMATVAPGGSVTVRSAGGFANRLTTVAAVEGGDELWFGRPAFVGGGEMTLTFPTEPGALRYVVTGPCLFSVANSVPTVTLYLTPGCAATRPLVVGAEQDDGTYRYLVKLDATPANGATLALTGPWLDPVPAARATVTNLPSGAIAFAHNAAFTAGGQMLGAASSPTDADADPLEFAGPPGIDAGVVLSMYYAADDTISLVRHVSPIPTAPVVLDATTPIATITNLVRTNDTFTWTRGAGPADAMVFDASYEDPKGNGETDAFWLIVTSPDAGRLTMPSIPDAPFVELNNIAVTDIDILDGNDAIRPRIGMGMWLYDFPSPLPPFTRVARNIEGF